MDLSYDLMRQLKNAGFPLNSLGKSFPNESEGRMMFAGTVIDGEWYQFPYLSQLIEASKKHGFLISLDQTPGGWEAYIQDDENYTFVATKGVGLTPKEAVARLWIALNKKP